MREEYKVFALCLVTLTAFSGMGMLASATTTTPFVTTIAGTWDTEGHAGYMAYGGYHSVVAVSGGWEVPSVNRPQEKGSRSCFWVAISDANTVQQIGTESDYNWDGVDYYAWWATGEGVQQRISSVSARPGDAMWAEVKYMGNDVFYLTIQDWTTGESFSTYQTDTNAERRYANWIAEAPKWVLRFWFWTWQGVYSLANFGTVTFNYCFATMSNAYDTPPTVGGSISSFEWYKVTMADGSYIKAVPSDLFNAGTSFTVTWYNH